MASTYLSELEEVFDKIPALSLLWNWSAMDEQDKQNLVRSIELYTSPVYDNNVTLFNTSLKLSLFNQFMRYFYHYSEKSTLSLDILICNCLAKSSDVELYQYFFQLRHDNYTNFEVSNDFDHYVTAWFENSSGPNFYLVAFSFLDISKNSDAHFVTVMLKKENGGIVFRVLNTIEKVFMNIDQEAHFLERMLQDVIPNAREVVYLPFLCPMLQYGLGPNCVQWSAFFILYLAEHPEEFANPNRFLESITEGPMTTIMLFQLFYFFFQISFDRNFITKIVYDYHNVLPAYADQVEGKRAENENELRDVVQLMFHVPNCYENTTEEKCSSNVRCTWCDTSCVNNNLIKDKYLYSKPSCVVQDLYLLVEELVNLQHYFVDKRILPFIKSFSLFELFHYKPLKEIFNELLSENVLPQGEVLEAMNSLNQ